VAIYGQDMQQTQEDIIRIDELDLHEECLNACRSSIIMQYMDQYPEELARPDECGLLPLHSLLCNESSSEDLAFMMIEKYPAALQHPTTDGSLPLHLECSYQCRSSIISKCIELYPEALAVGHEDGSTPLYYLLDNSASTVEQALDMIDSYPEAAGRPYWFSRYPIFMECKGRCRLPVILKCIEVAPSSSTCADDQGNLPMHILHSNNSFPIEDFLAVIEKCPRALKCEDRDGLLLIHRESENGCRLPVIARFIELCPSLLPFASEMGRPVLHWYLEREASEDVTLMIMENYPAALSHRDNMGFLPIQIEVRNQCRSLIISEFVMQYPESLNDTNWDRAVSCAFRYRINKSNFHQYRDGLKHLFILRPIFLYLHEIDYLRYKDDARADPHFRRQLLNLLPHDFVKSLPTHDADYRDLNWQPRAAMMMLLSQIKIKILSQQQGRKL
jgi:hypothetical protein